MDYLGLIERLKKSAMIYHGLIFKRAVYPFEIPCMFGVEALKSTVTAASCCGAVLL